MRKSSCTFTILILLLGGLLVAGTACGKKKVATTVTPTAPPRPPDPSKPSAPAPTITLEASPSTITSGQPSTLKWNSTDATSITIDGGIGTVEASGSRQVTPAASITYTAKASGPGGSANTSARVTVTEAAATPPPKSTLVADEAWFTTNIDDIFFDYDEYAIRDDARATLQTNARGLTERGHLNFTIEGHTDERGSEKYNLALGDRRANATKEFLVAQGIGANRIETVSYGEERPFDPGHNETAWSKNRRAHFILK
jgi:peptidoglycan-associated lipoprotein